MTHFSVAVIDTGEYDDIYEFLARYDETREVEPYVYMPRAEALAEAKEKVSRAAGKVSDGTADEYDRRLASHAQDDDEKLLGWYADEWCQSERDEDGNFLSTYNPDSRYDYFSEVDELSFDEWLDTGDGDEEKLRADWKELSTAGDGFWKPEYYTRTYGDEDTFVKSCMLPAGWAVVTPDGQWHEPGKMGWFACDDSTPESRKAWADSFHEKFVEPYRDRDARVVMLDCHI